MNAHDVADASEGDFRRIIRTGGCLVQLISEVPSVGQALQDATGGRAPNAATDRFAAPDLRVVFERKHDSFDTTGMTQLVRGVWSDGRGTLVLENIGNSGFCQQWSTHSTPIVVRTRWAPSSLAAAVAQAMPAWFRGVRAQIVLHHPVLWWGAMAHGYAPVHASVIDVHGVCVLLAGPTGAGKSTLLAHELRRGAFATCDNLGVTDGQTVHGLCEPLRLPPELDLLWGGGTHPTAEWREHSWRSRVADLAPDLVLVVRRDATSATPELRPLSPDRASRTLVAGTYASSELGRFWPLASNLALATDVGPAHPPVEAMATRLTTAVPCYEVGLEDPSVRLADLLADPLLELQPRTG